MLNFFEQTFKKIIQKKITFNKELEIDYIIHNDTNIIWRNGSSKIDNNKTWNEYINGKLGNQYSGDILPGTVEFETLNDWEKSVYDIDWKK